MPSTKRKKQICKKILIRSMHQL